MEQIGTACLLEHHSVLSNEAMRDNRRPEMEDKCLASSGVGLSRSAWQPLHSPLRLRRWLL
jgi:hypothetical protein